MALDLVEEANLKKAEIPILFRQIKDPSEAVKLVAVKASPWAILDIKNPSPILQLTAVTGDCDTIAYLKTPTEEAQFCAIKQKPQLIFVIQNPCLAIQKLIKKIKKEIEKF
jgi:hypothetical protein